MKKLFSWLLAGFMAFSLTAGSIGCKKDDKEKKEEKKEEKKDK